MLGYGTRETLLNVGIAFITMQKCSLTEEWNKLRVYVCHTNVNWNNHLGKEFGILTHLKRHIHNLTSLLLHIRTVKKKCAPTIFIAIFIKAKKNQQNKDWTFILWNIKQQFYKTELQLQLTTR